MRSELLTVPLTFWAKTAREVSVLTPPPKLSDRATTLYKKRIAKGIERLEQRAEAVHDEAARGPG